MNYQRIATFNEVDWSVRSGEYVPFEQLAIAHREGADAKITGTTRSLDRRTLGLNILGKLPAPMRQEANAITHPESHVSSQS